MINASSKTIKRISIINADTGIETHQKDYEPSFFLNKDNQLISGFISALVQFSQEIVKDNIQEMVFSNSQLYLMRFPTVLIVILTPIGIPLEKLTPVFDVLGDQIERKFTSEQLDFITPELSIEIETVIDKCLEKDVQFPTFPITKQDITPKLVVAGLRKAGKTTAIKSFFDSWDKEQLQTIRPTVDYSVFHSFLEVMKTELTIFDLGGQSQYIDRHVMDRSKWKGASAVLFLVDMHKPDEFPAAHIYLENILKIYESMDETPFIALIGHKYDPEMLSELQPNLMKLLKTFKDVFKWPRYSVFLSSIYDDSLYLALMRTLVRIIPRDLLQNIVSSTIFFETQNRVWSTISEEVVPEANSPYFLTKIINLSIPYGEKLANTIFREWLSGDYDKDIKHNPELIGVKLIDIAGGLQISIEMPKEENSHIMIPVIEGLLTGLGNVFGFSRIMRLHMDQRPGYISTSWGLYEF